MKYKFLLVLAILFIYASSCKEDEPEIEPFDHAAQAIKDNDSLEKYFQTHFINTEGDLQEMTEETTSETSLSDDANLIEETITQNLAGDDIDLKLYHYITSEGSVDNAPARVDRAHVKYVGTTLDGEVFDRNDYGSWWDLYASVVKGWSYGILHFKPGTKTYIEGEDVYEYSEYGKGYLFIPSGLTYQNTGELANKPLIFKIELDDVFHVDHDLDGILSMYEVAENGKYVDLDTDSDEKPNFVDNDDDGDGTLTKDEHADPDGDGNPSDALDGDSDGIPDYLDPDTH